MALIKCPECGKEISDKAASCPNCGCPIKKASDQVQPVLGQAKKSVTSPPKKKHGCLIVVIGFLFICFIIGITSKTGSSSSNNSSSSANSLDVTTSETAKTPEETAVTDNREAALEADKQITELVQAAENDYNILANMIASGEASDLDLYDTAKKVDSNLGSYQVNVSKIKCDGIKDYSDAASSYIINMQLTASYVKKYVDKQKMADLSSAKECIANMNNYVLNLISKKMEFLKASGYTDEEIMNMLSEMGETEATSE